LGIFSEMALFFMSDVLAVVCYYTKCGLKNWLLLTLQLSALWLCHCSLLALSCLVLGCLGMGTGADITVLLLTSWYASSVTTSSVLRSLTAQISLTLYLLPLFSLLPITVFSIFKIFSPNIHRLTNDKMAEHPDLGI
jgi:hypothetical protein